MKNRAKTIDIMGYYAGAVADFIFGFVMIFFADFTHFIWGMDEVPSMPEILWMRYFGVIVFAWGIVLLWGSRKPEERRLLLLFTVVPVLASFILLEIMAYVAGVMGLPNLFLLGIVQAALCLILLVNFHATGKTAAGEAIPSP